MNTPELVYMHTQYIHACQTDHKSKKGKYELKKWKVETRKIERRRYRFKVVLSICYKKFQFKERIKKIDKQT